MPELDQKLIHDISVAIIPILFAITLHEVAHGWVAKRLGDPTAYMLGRLTVNPLKHIDPIGTVLVPLALLIFAPAGILFGWAKPVPVSAPNLRNPKRDMAIVAIAGPISNLLMGTFWAVLFALIIAMPFLTGAIPQLIADMCVMGMWINVILAVVNMIPIPPLDGGRVLVAALPGKISNVVERVEPFGLIILVILMVTQVLGPVVEGPANSLLAVYHSIAGLA